MKSVPASSLCSQEIEGLTVTVVKKKNFSLKPGILDVLHHQCKFDVIAWTRLKWKHSKRFVESGMNTSLSKEMLFSQSLHTDINFGNNAMYHKETRVMRRL